VLDLQLETPIEDGLRWSVVREWRSRQWAEKRREHR
jgi:hypothetical protein